MEIFDLITRESRIDYILVKPWQYSYIYICFVKKNTKSATLTHPLTDKNCTIQDILHVR